MLLPLSTTRYAAWCNRCLRGSEVISCGAVAVARFVAIEHLRCIGWLHVAPADVPAAGRQDCVRLWSGETYCPECKGAVLAARFPPAQPPRAESTPVPPSATRSTAAIDRTRAPRAQPAQQELYASSGYAEHAQYARRRA